jgi:Peptidase family M48
MTLSSDELKRLWKIKAVEARNGALWATLSYRGFIFGLIVSPVFRLLIKLSSFSESDYLGEENLSSFIDIVLTTIEIEEVIISIVLIVLLHRFTSQHKRYFRQNKSKGNIILFDTLDRKISLPMIHTIHRLSNEMGVVNSITIWLDRKTQSSAPSISSDKRHADLLIPLPFLKLWSKDVEAASAIIAHELSHLVQDDSKYWYYPSVMVKVLIIQFAIESIIYLFLTYNFIRLGQFNQIAYLGQFTNLEVWFVQNIDLIVSFIVFLISYSYVLSSLRKSEKTADLAALAFTSPSAITKALQYFETGNTRKLFKFIGFHPTTTQRLKNIETTLTTSSSELPEKPLLFSVWSTVSLYIAFFGQLTFPIPLILGFWAWKEIILDGKERRGLAINMIASLLSSLPLLYLWFLWFYIQGFDFSFLISTNPLNMVTDPSVILHNVFAITLSLPSILLGIKFSKEFREATASFQG